MDEAVRIEITGKIDGKIARAIRDIAGAALEADTALDTLREAITAFTPGQHLRTAVNEYRELRNEINRVKQTQQTLVTSNKGTAGSFKDAAASADRYAASLRKVDAANSRTAGGFSNLRGLVGSVIGLFGGIFAVKYAVDAQDALTTLQNKVRQVVPDLENQARIQERLFDIANRTRVSVSGVGDAYLRFSKALQSTGVSADFTANFVEVLNMAMATAGKNTAEVNSIVTQLGQALTAGRLNGDEFRSLRENLPVEVLESFAKQLGVTRAELGKLSEQGKLTNDIILKGIAENEAAIREAFARTVPTIGGALVVLENNFIRTMKNSAGGAALVAQAIMFIGDNLNLVIPIVALFAAGWAAVGIVRITAEILTLARTAAALGTAMLVTHGVMLLWIGVFALVSAAIASVIYMIANFIGKGEEFEAWLAGSIQTMQNWVGGIVGMVGGTKEAAAAGESLKAELDRLGSALNTTTKATNDNTKAANDNAKAVKDWAKETTTAVNAVTYSYNQLSAARKAALAEGASKHYAQLTAAGGSSGSFTAVPTGTNQTGSFTKLPAFARGGSIQVGGRSGIDRNVLPIRVSRGERVDISTREQQRREGQQNGGPPIMVFNVVTPDAESFRRSRGQIASDMIAALL